MPPGGASSSTGPAVNSATTNTNTNTNTEPHPPLDTNGTGNANGNGTKEAIMGNHVPETERHSQITESQHSETKTNTNINQQQPSGRIAFTNKNALKDTTSTTPTPTRRPRPSLMNHESIALALRLTCEMNQRLVRGISSLPDEIHSLITVPPSHELEGGLVHVHPSQAWERPIASHRSQAMTPPPKSQHADSNYNHLFLTPSTTKAISILKQPSNLSHYISTVTQSLSLESSPSLPLIQAIALLYLDRACSVETTRAEPNAKCPFVTLENVTLLYQTALVLACRTVRDELPFATIRGGGHFHDEVTAKYAHFLSLGGIDVTARQLGDRLDFMSRCLGSEGFAIHSMQVDTLLSNWKHVFHQESEEIQSGNGRGEYQSEKGEGRRRQIETYSNGSNVDYSMPPDGSNLEGSLDNQQGDSWDAPKDTSYTRDVHDQSQYTSDPMMHESQQYSNEWGGMDQNQMPQNDIYQNLI